MLLESTLKSWKLSTHSEFTRFRPKNLLRSFSETVSSWAEKKTHRVFWSFAFERPKDGRKGIVWTSQHMYSWYLSIYKYAIHIYIIIYIHFYIVCVCTVYIYRYIYIWIHWGEKKSAHKSLRPFFDKPVKMFCCFVTCNNFLSAFEKCLSLGQCRTGFVFHTSHVQ